MTGISTVVATDHYAEATEAIIKHLGDLGVPAVNITAASGICRERILVANSADLGVRKTQRSFWEACRRVLGSALFQRIVLVDDFGYNEVAEDAYGEKEKVVHRRRLTEEIIGAVFSLPILTVPFFIEQGHDAGAVIHETVARIRHLLREGT
ncbi:MAG: hypothetical protein N2Z74_08165 [Syntrophales bacterium]|nr:hypothetical protein [Syntrophales bacterium]